LKYIIFFHKNKTEITKKIEKLTFGQNNRMFDDKKVFTVAGVAS